MRTASRSTTSSSRDITTEEHDNNHIAAPVVCGADQGVVASDPSSLTAPPTRCWLVCQSSDATVDVLPKLVASVANDEDRNLETISVAPLAPTNYSTGGLAHGHDGDSPVVVSVVLQTMTPSSTACPHPSPNRRF
jgi:hypothetical protein